MKFDTLCNIVLEGKRQEQLSRITVVNPEPTFTIEDVLKDPNDPSKGVKSYLENANIGYDAEEEVDDERRARRALRRLTWVAKSVLKRYSSREINLRKLHLDIIIMIEKYLTQVSGFDQEKLDSLELKIAKEAALIGNILLPPTTRNPNAKGAFGIVTSSLPKEMQPDKKETGFRVADRLAQEFNMTVEEYIAAFDPDLIGTIKDVIRSGVRRKEKPIIDDGAVEESFDIDGISEDGVEVSDLLKDPRIKNIYDPRVVRKTLRSLIDMGSIIMNPEGKLILPTAGTEEWRKGVDKAKDASALAKLEDFPEEKEVADLADTFGEEPEVAPEDDGEDDENWAGEHGRSGIAATRLGYRRPSRDVVPSDDSEDDGKPDGGEQDDGEEPWYK